MTLRRSRSAGRLDGRQDGGTYRLERRADDALFGYAVGPHSWKKFLHPPRCRLWRARPDGDDGGSRSSRSPSRRPPSPSSACAPASCTRSRIQDRVLLGGPCRSALPGRRDGAFIVAVNCGEAGGTCFCVSMDTGPKARLRLRPGADRAPRRQASTTSWSRRAATRAPRCWPGCRTAPAGDEASRGRGARSSSAPPPAMGRQMDTDGIKELLLAQPRAPALGRRRRALPHLRQLHDGLPDLLLHLGRGHERPRRRGRGARASRWDSCFTMDFSYVHGGSVRLVGPLALPPVDDPQARHLVRPVRHLGLRRLRPLHHLVPGRHRHHRGGRRDPRRRPAADARRGADAMKAMDDARRRASRLRRARRRPRSSWSPAAPRTCVSTPASTCSARASRRTAST